MNCRRRAKSRARPAAQRAGRARCARGRPRECARYGVRSNGSRSERRARRAASPRMLPADGSVQQSCGCSRVTRGAGATSASRGKPAIATSATLQPRRNTSFAQSANASGACSTPRIAAPRRRRGQHAACRQARELRTRCIERRPTPSPVAYSSSDESSWSVDARRQRDAGRARPRRPTARSETRSAERDRHEARASSTLEHRRTACAGRGKDGSSDSHGCAREDPSSITPRSPA